MCDHFDQTPTWTMVLDNANLFFIVVFTSEMSLKIFALRKHYFLEPWNLFDFIVVLMSLASLFLSDLIEKYFVSPTLLRIVRNAFLLYSSKFFCPIIYMKFQKGAGSKNWKSSSPHQRSQRNKNSFIFFSDGISSIGKVASNNKE